MHDSPSAPGPLPGRCVIVLDSALPPGKAANAAAVLALTLGQRHPGLVGGPLVDAAGCAHPGLIPIGIAVLQAPAGDLPALRARALETGCDVVDFPVEGQRTTDYAAFLEAFRACPVEAQAYLGVALAGPAKTVRRLTGGFGLVR